MPLIDLQTNLKSLKYGHDRPGGGSSDQPYIQNDINNPKDVLGFDDGFIRGGAVGAARASLNDESRIAKFLVDLPKGPLWIAKQVGLQLSNPKLETRAGLGGFLSIFGQPTRIYNLGINTLAQVPVNAFGTHFDRHGFLPIQDNNTKYLAIAQANDAKGTNGVNNRLVKYRNKLTAPKSLGILARTLSSFFQSPAFSLLSTLNQNVIDSYIGGPKSVYGLGTTTIRRYDYTNSTPVKIPILNTRGIQNITTNFKYATPISNMYGANTNPNILNKSTVKYTTNIPAGSNGTSNSPTFRKYSDLKRQVDAQAKGTVFNIASLKYTTLGKDGFLDGYNGEIKSYTSNAVIYKNGIDKPLNLGGTWNVLNRETRIGSGREDSINLTPIFENVDTNSIVSGKQGTFIIEDLVRFRIQAIRGEKPTLSDYMIFRAYITQLSDSTDASWSPIKYIGRGEEFYIYTGFTRKVTVGFQVAALSSKEMDFMYKKLNFLQSNLMPDYSLGGYMRGPVMKMTIGNWFYNQDCILNSLSYTVPNDSPWEIGIQTAGGPVPLVLPHIVEVQMVFTPIGSQTSGKNLISRKSTTNTNIAQK